MSARLRLRRADGDVYLDRWGFEFPAKSDEPYRRPWFGVFVHRMDAADPGHDLHDHPWWFGSLILWGGYTEERAAVRDAPMFARFAEHFDDTCTRGVPTRRRWLSWRTMRLDECHRITELTRRRAWTLVVHGPTRRGWGFYLPEGWMAWREYDATVRAERRDMWAEISNDDRPVRSCRVCGCTQERACPGGCFWVGEDLCSTCGMTVPAASSRHCCVSCGGPWPCPNPTHVVRCCDVTDD